MKFKKFIEMASADDIRGSDLREARTAQEATRIVRSMNSEQLLVGEGWYASVYGDEGPLVIKISNSRFDGAYRFLNFAKSKSNLGTQSPYPRISFMKSFEDGEGFLAIMEKLNFYPSAVDHAWKPEEWAADMRDPYADLQFAFFERNEGSEIWKRFSKVHPKVAKAFEDMISIGFEEGADLHRANVAARGSYPVIVDPMSDTGTIGR